MVFAHRDHAAAALVDEHVGVADVRVGRDGSRLRAGVLAVEALVLVVGKETRSVLDREVAAAILVDAAARVEALRRHVARRAIRAALAHDDAATLERTQL